MLKENLRSRSCTSRRRYSSYCNAIRIYQYICIVAVHVVGIGAVLYEIVVEGRVSCLPVWKEAPNQGGSVPAVPGGSTLDLLHTGRNNFPLTRSYTDTYYVICVRNRTLFTEYWHFITNILNMICTNSFLGWWVCYAIVSGVSRNLLFEKHLMSFSFFVALSRVTYSTVDRLFFFII